MQEFWIKFLVPFAMPLLPSQRIFVVYLLSALVLAFAVYIVTRRRAAGFFKYCFPLSVYAHPSALVDYWYFFVNKIAFAILLGPLVIGAAVVSDQVQAALGALAGGPGPGYAADWAAGAGFTVLSILAFDLGLFVAHTLQHRVPLLWQFHKVHHSAEVMTPITVYRMHPVDDLLSGTLVGLLTGLVHGAFAFLFDGGLAEFQVYEINVVLFLFYLLGYNLRHSHVWLPYPGWLSHVLISPAQHQIHHSSEPRHFDRNMGFIFAFWDKLAGTLYVPRGHEDFALGLAGGEHREFDSVWRLYALPFRKAAALFRPPRKAEERKQDA